MIAQVHGILLEASFTEAVVECGGVGYLVNIPLSTFDKLPQPGSEVSLYTNMTVREDDISLFGFFSKQEQKVFKLLVTVNGIGAKTALNILSSLNIPVFCQAVANADVKALKRINGVGPKSAERMIVELRDKIREIAPETQFPASSGAGKPSAADQEVEKALMALEKLGFVRAKIQTVVEKVVGSLPEKARNAGNILNHSLQALNGKN